MTSSSSTMGPPEGETGSGRDSADHDEAILERERSRLDAIHVDPGCDVTAILILEIPALEIAHRIVVLELDHEIPGHGVDLDRAPDRQVDEMDLVRARLVPRLVG